MKKKILLWILPALLISSGLAFASYLGDFLRAGIDPQGTSLSLNKAMNYNTSTITVAGPTDDLDVSGVNVVKIDTSSNAPTIGGVTGSVDGQVIQFVITDSTANATIEHSESTGNQDFYTNSGSDDTLTGYGGWTFVSDGSNLYEAAN